MKNEEMGTCKHGKFPLMAGCPQCIEERRAAGITPAQDEMEAGLNKEGLTLATQHIVKVQFYSETTGEVSSKPYTYFSEDRLEVGDIVSVPVRGTTTKARVCAVDVPEAEIAAFKDSVKIIPAGAIVADKPIDRVGPGGPGANTYGAKPEPEPSKDAIIISSDEDEPDPLPDIVIEPETALALRPGADVEVMSYYTEALKLQEYAEKRVITTPEHAATATDDLSQIAKLRKVMENKRKSLLDPLKLQSDAIRDTYNYLMAPVLEADKITRAKMVAYDTEQKRIRAEQEEINRKRQEAAEQEMKLKGELTESVNLVEVAPEPAKRVATDLGTAGMVDCWKYEVVDLLAIPREYLVVDGAMLNAIAKRHHDQKQIPGVRFYNEPTIAVRTR